jgi:hypothetical protein
VAVEEDVLFPEPTIKRLSWLRSTEPAVHWYTECAHAEAARLAVNGWYREFPDPDGAMARRLRSAVDVDHYQSIDELYVHHLLAGHVEEVRYEEGGSGPDFRLYEGGLLVGAIEVASLFLRQDWTDDLSAHGALADEINRLVSTSAGWFINFQILQSDRQISPRRFARWIKDELAHLPDRHATLEARARQDEPAGRMPKATFVEEGVKIEVHFLPMREGAPSMTNPHARIVGAGPVLAGFVNSAQRLRDRIATKAPKRYGLADVPYLVMVGLHDLNCSEEEIVDAIYGREQFDPANRRRTGGVLGDNRNTRMSAVATMPAPAPWREPATTVSLWDHPSALRPWPGRFLQTDMRRDPAP